MSRALKVTAGALALALTLALAQGNAANVQTVHERDDFYRPT